MAATVIDSAEPVEAGVVAAVKKRKPKIPTGQEQSSWVIRKQKVNGRPGICVNEATNEVDILSLAIHSGISTDESLSEFMLRATTLDFLESAVTRSTKIEKNADGTIVTRYYTSGAEIPTKSDTRISYKQPVDDKTCRWAVPGHLVATICSLLDDTQRERVLVDQDEEIPVTSTSSVEGTMVTFRGKRTSLFTIPMREIEAAEQEILTSHAISLMRELICIRRIHHMNCEKGVMNLNAKMRDLEGSLRAEKMVRERETAVLKTEITGRNLEIANVKIECDKLIGINHSRDVLQIEECMARQSLITTYNESVMDLEWRLVRCLTKHVILRPPCLAVVLQREEVPVVAGIEDLRQELEDSKLEIARLKNDARGKAVPKPKAHRKTKDPDIHLATETEIKNSVKTHLSLHGRRISGSAASVASSVGSAFAARARKRVGTDVSTSELKEIEEREIEAGRKLKTLSRLREQDLCNVESESEQLIEVIEALSSLLTRVTLTIEDVSSRKVTILNHMRSLALHSRGITSLVRERTYLVSLARQMNRERRPIVNLGSLRALINVASLNFKHLKEIESITLESIGGAVEVMSLEEAASTILEDEPWEEVITVPNESSPYLQPKVLTRATLRRYDAMEERSASSVSE